MTPLFKKLNFKSHNPIHVLDAPASFDTELEAIKPFTTVKANDISDAAIRFAIVFVTQQQQIDRTIEQLAPKLEGDAVLWFCYPKVSSKRYRCDFNRDTGWQRLGDYGFEPVRQVAVDTDWSAIRFRKVIYIEQLTRKESFAMSPEGKKRLKKD